MKKEEVYGHIDHTLLKAFSTTEQIEAIAEEALKYGTASICIPASFVNYIHNKYKDVNICTVIGFPLGYSTTSIKVAEAKQAIEDGANEIDMVINIGWAKEHMSSTCTLTGTRPSPTTSTTTSAATLCTKCGSTVAGPRTRSAR